MYYLDLHTHQQAVHTEDLAIVCSLARADGRMEASSAVCCSYGIHPGQIVGDGEAQWQALLRCVADPACVAIGEAGLDRLSPCDEALQRILFERQALLAERLGKPLIIHCVKAWEEVMAFRKSVRPKQPWIIHGFRGKEALARQLLRQGCYLSFGRYFRPEAVRVAWPDRLFLETDAAEIDIRLVYERIAEALAMDLNALCDQIERNSAILRLKNTTFAPNMRE